LRIGELNNSDGGNNLINSNSSTQQQVSSNTPPQQQQQNSQTSNPPQPIQQGSPVPNSNTALNQRPPLSSPQPPSSISSSGDPTPTMPCVSSTPTHNVAASAGHSVQRTLQMMSSSSVSPNQQMANPNSHFASSSMMGQPHPMGHIGGPQSHMAQRMRPATHGGMTGPLRVGMHNQPHPMMSPHHTGMPRPGMAMGGMVTHHQNAGHRGIGQMHVTAGPQYMHPSTHHAMHGGHQMMPSQPQNIMRHMMPGGPVQMQPGMIHHGAQSHMAMHQNSRPFGPRSVVPGGGMPNNMMQDDSQLLSGGMNPRLQGPMMRTDGMGGARPLHNDVGGPGFRPMSPAQQQQGMNSAGQTMPTGGTINTMPGDLAHVVGNGGECTIGTFPGVWIAQVSCPWCLAHLHCGMI
jgi:hypothetical protein